MKYNRILVPVLILWSFASCNPKEKSGKKEASHPGKTEATISTEEKMDQAEVLTAETIQAHGGSLYDEAFYGFTFRKKQYTFQNRKGSYTYTVKSGDQGKEIQDVLENGVLTRTINGSATPLSEKEIAKYFEALNSVVYFVTLPHKLKDRAVNKTYEGPTMIKGRAYDVLGIGFDQDGGGVDYDDQFHYWINKETKTIDYLAYSYSTNEGGVRFRSAYNPRTVGGIRFQDYINYEAPIGTPLKDLPALYETGALKELSRIITENVVDLKQ